MLPSLAVLVALSTASLCAVEPRTLTVFLDHSAPYSSSLAATMQAELARVVSPLGLQLSWKKFSERTLGEDFDQLVVVKLEGSCSTSTLLSGPRPVSQRRLASAEVSNGFVLPFATVECDNLKRTIASGLIGQKAEVQEQRLGRAMARVLAHELYHILGATRHHHSSGVAKACFGPGDLLAQEFNLDPLSLAQMRVTPQVEEPLDYPADASGR